MALSTDFLFTASRLEIPALWWEERYTKVTAIKLSSDSGSHTKITSLTTDDDGGLLLVVGTYDGKIQVCKFFLLSSLVS